MSTENEKPAEPIASVKISDLVTAVPAKPAGLATQIISACLVPFLLAIFSGVAAWCCFNEMAHPKQFWGAFTLLLGGIWYMLLGAIASLACFGFSLRTLSKLGDILDRSKGPK